MVWELILNLALASVGLPEGLLGAVKIHPCLPPPVGQQQLQIVVCAVLEDLLSTYYDKVMELLKGFQRRKGSYQVKVLAVWLEMQGVK